MSDPSTFSDVIRVEDQYYILATSALADERTRVLKHGDLFGVFDRSGDVYPVGLGEQGLYLGGTRFISSAVLRFGMQLPLLLSSTIRRDNMLLVVDLTNPDIVDRSGTVLVPRGSVHIRRTKFLWNNVCYERLSLSNFHSHPVELSLTLQLESDFADIFEVRGLKREKRGRMIDLPASNECFTLAYEGLDGVVRRAIVSCEAHPSSTFRRALEFPMTLANHGNAAFQFSIRCETDDVHALALPYDQALDEATDAVAGARASRQEIVTSSAQCNDWLQRAWADLTMMMTPTSQGIYPYAGVPWFNTPFGRDGIITALAMLFVDPIPARGVLQYLAAVQATITEQDSEAQPGKILHEARSGEMAALREIPFGRYYGSVDSTPLFIMLAGAYFTRTGDLDFIESIWSNIEAALGWIDRFGDLDGDGFVEYFRLSPRGLVHQGWKDSNDSIFHSDGALAEGPIALCEVQGYVYAAKREAAILARALGKSEQAAALKRESEKIRKQFEERFWCEKLGTYVLALDGEKRQCQVRASNAGHALFVGIANPKRAQRTAQTLLNEAMFSGWGIRTLADSEARYNPMSYHNGSVWPHDNALIAAGFARYGLKQEALTILSALADASTFFELNRLPELFCGFPRRAGESPTLYPVACAPQSWAAASVFLLLQSCLGVSIHALDQEIRILHPVLPESLNEVRILGLRVGEAQADLLFRRLPDSPDVAVSVLRREGSVRIMTLR